MRATETAERAMRGVDLVACSEAYFSIYLRGYADGCGVGYELHRREVEAADEAAWLASLQLAPSNPVRYSQLCERRGEHERAERAREHERRLGLIA